MLREESMATAKVKDTPTEAPDQDENVLEHAIRLRAYEISQSADAGTPQENWERAERELGPAS
jgi:hypothetical protein